MSTQLESSRRAFTTSQAIEMKSRGEKIAVLTAYDFTTARLLDLAGVDIVLVGDSASNVFAGNETTLPMTLDEMIYHVRAVVKGVHAATGRAMIVADMPFMTYQLSPEDALKNAGRLMKETGCHAVKLEGGATVADAVKRITNAGIPVMAHLGLTPQSIYKFGSYKVRARDEAEAETLLCDAKLLEESGAFAIVLEKIPKALAEKVTHSVGIPTIGIGAGNACDGQVLVINDMLGLNNTFKPRFVRRYANLEQIISDAVKTYVADVKRRDFPNENESY